MNESLSNNSNYPPMSDYDWNRSPWNDYENDDKEFDVSISQTLSKSTTIETNDYVLRGEYLDPEDGGYYEYADTSETNWKESYAFNHYTPLELIALLKKEYLKKLEVAKSRLKYSNQSRSLEYDIRHYQGIIDECKNWIEDDFEVIPE